MGQQQGGSPFPCRHLPTNLPPGRFPYLPFPVFRIKSHGDPVAVPSSAPSLLLLIPSFSLLCLLSNGTFLHSLPLHILFYFTLLPWSYQVTKLFATLSFSQSYRGVYIYIYTHTHIYIHKPFKLLVGPHVASLLPRPSAKYTKYLSCILLSPPRSVDPQARKISEDALVQYARPSSNLRGLGASCTRRRSRGPYVARSQPHLVGYLRWKGR